MTREQMLENAKYAEECEQECRDHGIDESQYSSEKNYWYRQLWLLDNKG